MRVEYKTRNLTYTHFKTNPGPDPAEDEKTLDARMAEIVKAFDTARRPTRQRARAWITPVFATALWERAQPGVTHPHSIRRAAKKGTFSRCTKRGHSHVALTHKDWKVLPQSSDFATVAVTSPKSSGVPTASAAATGPSAPAPVGV